MNKTPCKNCGSTTWYSWGSRGNQEWCSDCSNYHSPSYEFVPDEIKEDRKKYFKEIVQPFRQGELSKEFVETNPKEAKRYASEGEIRKAKYVWKDLPGWGDHYGRR